MSHKATDDGQGRPVAERPHGIHCGGGRTKTSFQRECDVNFIVKRMEQNGLTNHVNPLPPMYGDFTQVMDFQASLEAVNAAQRTFDNLPSRIRNRFVNRPELLMEFMDNPENLEEAITLGLVEPDPEPEPSPPEPPPSPSPPEPEPPPG